MLELIQGLPILVLCILWIVGFVWGAFIIFNAFLHILHNEIYRKYKEKY